MTTTVRKASQLTAENRRLTSDLGLVYSNYFTYDSAGNRTIWQRAETGKAVATIYTIGHSTRTPDEFLALLRQHRIEVLADVRAYPSSRKFPHFNQAALAEALSREGIEYRWHQALGGRRHGTPLADSPNRGLRSPGFRNYADYMRSAEFQAAAADLRALARSRRLALMCAERLYWRCHRRLLSDYLSAQGDEVLHIESADRLLPHELTPGAHSEKGEITYPGEERLF